VLGNEVGGLGFIVKVSGAPKFKGMGWVFGDRAGKIVSKKRQLAKRAL
jgi:hypothetical protein